MNEQTKILIVDDQKEVREMFAIYLKIRGFQCFVAANALEAIRMQEQNTPRRRGDRF